MTTICRRAVDEIVHLILKLLLQRTASVERVIGEINNFITSSTAMILIDLFSSRYLLELYEYAESEKSSAVVEFKITSC